MTIRVALETKLTDRLLNNSSPSFGALFIIVNFANDGNHNYPIQYGTLHYKVLRTTSYVTFQPYSVKYLAWFSPAWLDFIPYIGTTKKFGYIPSLTKYVIESVFGGIDELPETEKRKVWDIRR